MEPGGGEPLGTEEEDAAKLGDLLDELETLSEEEVRRQLEEQIG